MKRKDYTDPDDGTEALDIEWGDGCRVRASLSFDDDSGDGQAWTTSFVRSASISQGFLDADDARQLAIFWADVAERLGRSAA